MKDQSVVGIIFNESKDKILLIKRRDIPVWTLPGGGIEEKESPEKAIVREILEETLCNVKIIRKIAEYIPKNRLSKYTYFYECKIISGFPQTNEEAIDINFFSLNNLPKKIPPPYPNWIEDSKKNNKQVLIKKIENVNYFILTKNIILHPILTFRFLLTKIGIHINSKK